MNSARALMRGPGPREGQGGGPRDRWPRRPGGAVAAGYQRKVGEEPGDAHEHLPAAGRTRAPGDYDPLLHLCSLWPTEGMWRILYRLESVLEA